MSTVLVESMEAWKHGPRCLRCGSRINSLPRSTCDQPLHLAYYQRVLRKSRLKTSRMRLLFGYWWDVHGSAFKNSNAPDLISFGGESRSHSGRHWLRERRTNCKIVHWVGYGLRLIEQGNCCAIDKKPFRNRHDCHADHDHLTKAFRGIICFYHNRSIAVMDQNLKEVLAYLAG